MGILRLQFPALVKKPARKDTLSRIPAPQPDAQRSTHVSAESRAELYIQAERAGLVIRHQQLGPVFSPALKLYSGYGRPHAPSVELHVAMPDTVPYVNSVHHVASAITYPVFVPATDGSKIMAA